LIRKLAILYSVIQKTNHFTFQANNKKEIRNPDELELHQCKEIVDCELTRVRNIFFYLGESTLQLLFSTSIRLVREITKFECLVLLKHVILDIKRNNIIAITN